MIILMFSGKKMWNKKGEDVKH